MQRLRDFLKRLNDTDLVDFSEPETGRAISTGYRKKADVLEWFAEEQLDIVGIYKCVDNRDGTYKAYMKGVFTDAPAESDFDDYVSFCYAEQDETKMPMPKPKEIKEHTDMETPQELFDVKDVFTSVNADDATAYVDKYVYRSNSLAGLRKDVKEHKFCVLDGVLDDSNDKRFVDGERKFSLCLPYDKVKQPHKEKKYRPFKSVMEFELYTGFAVGAKLTVRGKNWNDSDGMHLMYVGNGMHDGVETLGLGNMCMPIADWFDYEYLWHEDNLEEWRPFGVPEDER